MRVVEGFSGHLLEWLITGKIDVAVLYNAPRISNLSSEPLLQEEISLLDESLKASEADIAKLQAKLREARARQNSIMTRLESANHRAKMREMYAGPKIDEAFSRFEILERRVDYAEGRADAAGMGAAPKTLDEEIAELRSSDKVDAELAALKARTQGKGA